MNKNIDVINNLTKKDIKSLILKSSSLQDMMRRLGLTKSAFYVLKKKLKKCDLKPDFSFFRKKYNHNVKYNIFRTINTKEKAYWLGFLAADGHISKNSNGLSFMLSIKDEDQLNRFIKFIGGDLKAKKYYIGSFNTKKVYFSVYNEQLSKSVKKTGLVSPKSKNLKLLRFKNESLNLAYLMGYYDGDGNASDPTLSSGSISFLRKIKEKYRLPGRIKLSKSKLGSVYTLYIGMALIKKLLKNYKKSMPRKRDIIKHIFYKNACSCNRLKSKKSLNCRKCQQRKVIKKINLSLVLKDMKAGVPLSLISKKHNISDLGLKKKLIKEKIYGENSFSFKNKRKTKFKIISMYKKEKTVDDILKKVSIGKCRIKEIIREYKVKFENYKPVLNKRKIKYSIVKKEYFKTKSFSKTGKILGLHRSTVRRIIKKLDKSHPN